METQIAPILMSKLNVILSGVGGACAPFIEAPIYGVVPPSQINFLCHCKVCSASMHKVVGLSYDDLLNATLVTVYVSIFVSVSCCAGCRVNNQVLGL